MLDRFSDWDAIILYGCDGIIDIFYMTDYQSLYEGKALEYNELS